jgi:hypothetical protein
MKEGKPGDQTCPKIGRWNRTRPASFSRLVCREALLRGSVGQVEPLHSQFGLLRRAKQPPSLKPLALRMRPCPNIRLLFSYTLSCLDRSFAMAGGINNPQRNESLESRQAELWVSNHKRLGGGGPAKTRPNMKQKDTPQTSSHLFSTLTSRPLVNRSRFSSARTRRELMTMFLRFTDTF